MRIMLLQRFRNASMCVVRSFTEGQLEKKVFMFPGQGCQFVGMVGDLTAQTNPKGYSMFAEASRQLGYDLLQICKEGPTDRLNATEVSQPAIFVSSMVAVESMIDSKQSLDKESIALGLSLGEYSALCFAGSFSFEDGICLTKARGKAMQLASEQTPTGMAAVLGLKEKDLINLVDSINTAIGSEELFIANHLDHAKFTVAGTDRACKMAKVLGRSHGAKLVKPLSVSGAFHTRYMAAAADILKEELLRVDIRPPKIPVVSNVTGGFHGENPQEIRDHLVRQLTEPVLWVDCMRCALPRSAPVPGKDSTKSKVHAFEFGPGTVCVDLFASFFGNVIDKKGSLIKNIESTGRVMTKRLS